MPQTLSVVKAAVGGFVGHTATHPDVVAVARERVAQATQQGALIDGHVEACGGALFLVLSHEHGERAEAVHRLAWEALAEASRVAAGLGQYGAGQDLLADAFSDTLHGAGPAVAEIELVERPSEPVVVFLGSQAAAGAFNLPLYRAFADPSNTAGLVLSDALHEGFSFEVHDTRLAKKVMFLAPEEVYDLLAFIGASSRYAVRRLISRNTGEVAAVAATDELGAIAGREAGGDGAIAIARAHGVFPTVGELIEPFATPHLVGGFLRGSHVGPWMPVGLPEATGGRFDGPPRVVALGFQLAGGRLVGPRDLFVDPSFDRARRQAGEIVDYLRAHGPFEPHRLPLDDAETLALPAAAARLAGRWADI